MKIKLIVLACVIVVSFFIITVYYAFLKTSAKDDVIGTETKRIDYVEVQKMTNYQLSAPHKVKLDFLSEKYKDTEFTIYKYQPAYIEYRKPFKEPADMRLLSPEDAQLATGSFTLRFPREVRHIYKDCIEAYLNSAERRGESKHKLTYAEMVNLKTKLRYWYKLEFSHKGEECCFIVYDSINNPNGAILSYTPYIKTPEGWKYVFEAWFGLEICDAFRRNLVKYLLTNFPFENSPYDPNNLPQRM